MGVGIRLTDVSYEYSESSESAAVRALDAVTLDIADGEFAVLMGPSGSGKSTLLHLIGGVDQSTGGSVSVGEQNLSAIDERELTRFRRTRVGFVFQFFHLIPTLTVSENVAFPLALNGMKRAEARERVEGVLRDVGLQHRATHHPNQLSGGEMQRVAIGRAIVHRPPLLIADEPTGNLDSHTGASILSLLTEIRALHRPTIVMATHAAEAAAIGDYIVRLSDGSIAGVERQR